MTLKALTRNAICPQCGHYFARKAETHKQLARQVCSARDFRVLDIIATGIDRMCKISAEFDPPLGKTQTQRAIWRLVTAGFIRKCGRRGTQLEATQQGRDVARVGQ